MSTVAVGSVLVVGSVNVDIVLRTPRRPRAGETVAAKNLSVYGGGKGANQAVASAQFAETAIVAAVGDDAAGREQVAELASAGVRTRHIATVSNRTGTAIIVVTPDGENSIVIDSGANELLEPGAIETAGAEGKPTVVLTQTEIRRDTVEAAARFAVSVGARLILNAAPVVELNSLTLASSDPLVVNEHEAADLLRMVAHTSLGVPPRSLAGALRDATGAKSVVVTLGADGATSSDGDGNLHIPALAVSVRDTTGAGDAFVGTLAGQLATGRSLNSAMVEAVAAAGRAVTYLGARPPSVVTATDGLNPQP